MEIPPGLFAESNILTPLVDSGWVKAVKFEIVLIHPIKFNN